METQHEKYLWLINRAKAVQPTVTAVAHPCDESSLQAAIEAARLGLIEPILVGPASRLREVAGRANQTEWFRSFGVVFANAEPDASVGSVSRRCRGAGRRVHGRGQFLCIRIRIGRSLRRVRQPQFRRTAHHGSVLPDTQSQGRFRRPCVPSRNEIGGDLSIDRW